MKNVTIVFDPNAGVSVPDGKAEDWILSNPNDTIGIGTEIMLYAVRCLHREGKINVEKILDAQNKYAEVLLDKDGRFTSNDFFCSEREFYLDNFIRRLL
jgi:hypothetical protein